MKNMLLYRAWDNYFSLEKKAKATSRKTKVLKELNKVEGMKHHGKQVIIYWMGRLFSLNWEKGFGILRKNIKWNEMK